MGAAPAPASKRPTAEMAQMSPSSWEGAGGARRQCFGGHASCSGPIAPLPPPRPFAGLLDCAAGLCGLCSQLTAVRWLWASSGRAGAGRCNRESVCKLRNALAGPQASLPMPDRQCSSRPSPFTLLIEHRSSADRRFTAWIARGATARAGHRSASQRSLGRLGGRLHQHQHQQGLGRTA